MSKGTQPSHRARITMLAVETNCAAPTRCRTSNDVDCRFNNDAALNWTPAASITVLAFGLPRKHSATLPPHAGAACIKNGRGRQVDQPDQRFPASCKCTTSYAHATTTKASTRNRLATVPPAESRGDKLRTCEPNRSICSVWILASSTKSALLSKKSPARTGVGAQHTHAWRTYHSQDVANVDTTTLMAPRHKNKCSQQRPGAYEMPTPTRAEPNNGSWAGDAIARPYKQRRNHQFPICWRCDAKPRTTAAKLLTRLPNSISWLNVSLALCDSACRLFCASARRSIAARRACRRLPCSAVLPLAGFATMTFTTGYGLTSTNARDCAPPAQS